MSITHPPSEAPVAVPVPEFQRLTYFYGQLLGPKDLQGEQTYLREKHRLANRFLHGFGVVCGLEVEPAPDAEDCVSDTEKDRRARREELEQVRRELAEVTEALGKLDEQDPKRVELVERRNDLQARLDGLEAQYQQNQRAGYGSGSQPVAGPCVRVTPGIALDCRGDEVVLRDSVELDLWRALSPEDQKRIESGHDRIWVSVCYCERKVDPARPLYDDGCSLPSAPTSTSGRP
jgi:hypothetical protein